MEIEKVFLTGKYAKQISEMQLQVKNGVYPIQLVSEASKSDLYLAIDLIDPIFFSGSTHHNILKVLIRQEPKIVLPQTYLEKNTINFDYIIDIGKPKSPDLNVLNCPQDLTSYLKNPKTKNDRVVIINSNLLSLVKGENYSLRRQALNGIENLDLYGYQWNNSFQKKIKNFFYRIKKICI